MKIREAEIKARCECVRENYERVSNTPEWATMTQGEKWATLTLECGCSRPALTLILNELKLTV